MVLSNFIAQWPWLRMGLGALHVLAAGCLLVVAFAWARRERRRRMVVLSAAVTVLAIALSYVAAVRPGDIPVEWITVLTHGLERKSIMHLTASGVNAGANFGVVVSALSAPMPTLRDVVWMNLLLAAIDAVIFLHVATYVSGPLWALVWTLAFAANPANFMAAFSELPTNLLAIYFFAGVVGWAALYDVPAQPRHIRAAAVGLCALLTVLVALTRIEVATIGIIALSAHAGAVLVGSDVWLRVWRPLRRPAERLLAFLSDHPAAVAVLCLVGVWFAQAGLPGIGRDEVAGVYPFNASILELPAFLPMVALPVAVTVAVLFGVVRALREFRRFAALPLSLVIVVRAYFAGQDSYHETARYLSYVLPAILLLGLVGQAEFYRLAQRWRLNWTRAARVAYIMAWFAFPLPGVAEFFMHPEYHSGGGVAQLLLDLNTQREMRHLVGLTENNPQCVFVGRVVEDRGDFRNAPAYDYAVFGAPMQQPVFVPERDASLGDVVARYASGAACVRLYYGSDCNVRFGDHCAAFVAGRRRLEEERFWSRPYNNNPFDYADGAPEIVLATYSWP